MLYATSPPDFLNQVAVVAVAFYIICSISFSISFSNSQRFAFPVLNSAGSKNTMYVLSLLVVLICFISFDNLHSFSRDFMVNNAWSFFFLLALLCSTVCFLVISQEFVDKKRIMAFEYDLIICFSILGLAVVNICDDFLTLYLAIELQSLCFYVLASFNKNSDSSAEAGVKYFILGAFSSGLLLFGFTLIYSFSGTFSFEAFERVNTQTESTIAFCGCLLFSTALFFKLGAFPFHMWLCDVYDGSIINVTAFFSSVPKIILLGFFIKITFICFSGELDFLRVMLLISGLGSICFASITALYQKRIKRLMAYSTVSHTGFLFLGMSCATIDSVKACAIYIVLYVLMTLALFSLLFLSGMRNDSQKYLINWTSLFERNFAAALAFALILCSVAGIPPLAGFYSKLCIMLCLLEKNMVYATIIITIFSSIACFYYIKLIKIFFFTSGYKSLFWWGTGSRNVELFVSVSLLIIIFFLSRPNILLDCSIIAASSLF